MKIYHVSFININSLFCINTTRCKYQYSKKKNVSRDVFIHSTVSMASPTTLPVCRRQEESCSRWSGVQLRLTYGATLRSRRTWSGWETTQCASREPWSRTGQGTDSLKRNRVVFEVSRADPSPFSVSTFIRPQPYLQLTSYFGLPFITRNAVWSQSVLS